MTVSFTYTHGSVDATHAKKHKQKMEASQEVTGDATINSIFDKEFIRKVGASLYGNKSKHGKAKKRGKRTEDTSTQEDQRMSEEAERELESWLNE